ncbi:MAG: response regulator transcription factor [Lachnospiraceae bacterium]|nr:response regulator transcription factor [Lachnospiraceae bacterium]
MNELLLITTDDGTELQIRDHFNSRDLPFRREHDAAAALMMLAVKPYPLIMIDTDGINRELPEIIDAVRQQSAAYVFIISSKCAESDAILALDAGADEYMTKPLRPGELAAKAAAVLRREKANGNVAEDGGELVEGRNICVDTQHRRVWVHGREKHPTRKEYELLLFLMRHPDQVFTKEELYRHVWGGEALGDMATVTVHIRKLRGMTEEKPAYPTIICTEWGVGYYFQGKEPQW